MGYKCPVTSRLTNPDTSRDYGLTLTRGLNAFVDFVDDAVERITARLERKRPAKIERQAEAVAKSA